LSQPQMPVPIWNSVLVPACLKQWTQGPCHACPAHDLPPEPTHAGVSQWVICRWHHNCTVSNAGCWDRHLGRRGASPLREWGGEVSAFQPAVRQFHMHHRRDERQPLSASCSVRSGLGDGSDGAPHVCVRCLRAWAISSKIASILNLGSDLGECDSPVPIKV